MLVHKTERALPTHLEKFRDLLFGHLLPAFCDNSEIEYPCSIEGFRPDSIKLSEVDAGNFLLAWNSEFLRVVGPGKYLVAQGKFKEQFFWELEKKKSPRPFTLWLEPVISLATLARLHFEFGWPKHLLGGEVRKGAFDAAAYRAPDLEHEHIACEVKKSHTELDTLIAHMMLFAINPELPQPPTGDKMRNAFNKVQGLREKRAPIFWAVGPETKSQVFKVEYGCDDVLQLLSTSERDLSFAAQ